MSEVPVQRRAGQRNLIVEDNHFVARQAESVLTDAGYEIVYIVATADDAVRVALDRRPQLVLVDIYLPGKRDGVDAAVEICLRASGSAAEALAATAPPLAWLPKPFNAKTLLIPAGGAAGSTNPSSKHFPTILSPRGDVCYLHIL